MESALNKINKKKTKLKRLIWKITMRKLDTTL